MTDVLPTPPTSPQLDPLAQPLARHANSALDAYLDAICDLVFAPTRQAVRAFEQEIDASIKTLDAGREPDGKWSAQAQWKAATTHRRQLRDALGQLTQTLERVAPGRRLAQARRVLCSAWEEGAAVESRSVSRTAPDALFASRKDDSLYVNSRKSMARMGRRMRKSPPEQTIPLGELARYHTVVRVPTALLPTFRTVEQEIARIAATVEALGTNAVYAALRAEQHCRHYAFFLTPDERHDVASAPATESAWPAVPPTPNPQAAQPDASSGSQVRVVETEGRKGADAIAEARAAALKLRDLLAAQPLGIDALRAQAQSAIQTAHIDWTRDVERGGTFLLSMRSRAIEPVKALRRHERDDEWAAWYERVAARLHTLLGVMSIPDIAHASLSQWLDALRSDVVEPMGRLISETSDLVTAPIGEVDAAFERSPEVAYKAVGDAMRETLGATRHAQEQIAALSVNQKIEESAKTLSLSIRGLTSEVAESVRVNGLHAQTVIGGGGEVDPEIGTLIETPRSHVKRALDAEAEHLGEKAAHPVRESVAALVKEMNDVPSVLRFNLETALSSLTSLVRPADADEGDEEHDVETGEQPIAPAERIAESRDLATNGLRRSAARLSGLSEPLARIVPDAASSAFAPVDRMLKRVIDRSGVEEGLRAQAADAQREALDQMRETTRRIGDGFEHAGWWLRKHARLLRVRVRGLLRRGREVVGVAGGGEIHELGTVEAIAGLDTLLERLPAPYRHLFSLRPVADPDLLKGRTADLARIRRHERQWRAGLRNALILSGASGSGLTSLVRIAETDVLADYDVHRIELRSRPPSADALAARLARALGLPTAAGASLAALRGAVHEQPAGERPPVVVLGGMEHLMLRTVGGADMARDVFLFLSQTDTRILWVGVVGTSGWQALRSALPQAAALVLTYEVGGLGRDALEEVIMARHGKSGLALHFEPIADKTSKAERMLLKARKGEIDTQPGLRRLYFDELSRVSGQNLTLALVYWLRSVVIDADGEVVRVHQPNRLSFAFLDSFDRAGAFTLKAFLDHRSLTIRELSQVMGGVPTRSAVEQFERVGNVLLIEPMPTANQPTPNPSSTEVSSAFGERAPVFFASGDADVRYRLRPVVIQPIVDYLRRQNVLRT